MNKLPKKCTFAHHRILDSGTFVSSFPPQVESYKANNIHILNTPVPSFGNFHMQTSDACHKGFAIFDHTERQNTVILNPSWLTSLSCESPHDFNVKTIEATANINFPINLCPKGSLLDYGATMQTLAFTLDKEKSDIFCICNPESKGKSNNVDFSSCDGLPQCEQIWSGNRLEIQSEFHEDTEEIDALLSSDEELNSTGHSPEDDASSNCLYEAEKNDGIRKRKFQIVALEEEGDASVGLGKADFINKDSRNSNIWGLKRKVCLKRQLSRKDPSVNILEQVCMGMNDYSSSSESSGIFREPLDPTKRVKIKANIRLLKNVIPGGNDLDTETVLSRAVQYVKCLEQRLQALERGES